MATGMNIGEGSGKVGAMFTYNGETVTISSADAKVVVAGTTVSRGDAQGFTVGTTGIMTATFPGVRLCRIRLTLKISPVATNTDNLTVIISVNDANTYEADSNDIDDATAELYFVETYALISNGDTIKAYVENEDSTANIVVAGYLDQVNTVPSSGYMIIDG